MIQIEFPYSNTKARNDVVIEAGNLGEVRELKKDKRRYVKIKLDPKKMKSALTFLKALKRLRDVNISLDGTATGFRTAFGWLDCYAKRVELGNNPDYCFGLEGEGNANIFGCRYTAMVEYGKMGDLDQKRVSWIFNKRQIKRAMKNETFKCSHCPAYNAKRMDRIVDALPNSVAPRGSKEWKFLTSFFIFPRSGVQRVESPFKNRADVLFVEGVYMIDEAPIDRISKKIGYQIPYDTLYQHIIRMDLND